MSDTIAEEWSIWVMSEEMLSIHATIGDSSRNVERPGNQSDREAEVVDLVEDIAGQTNQ